MATFRLPSFAKGEVSPKLYGRVDTSLYAIALRTLRNYTGERSGAVSNRPGTVFCDETRYPSKRCKPIRFTFNSTTANSYVMEFGDLYVEFLQSGGRVVESAKNIAGITQASPAVITSTAHGYSSNDDIYVSGVVGMPQVNNRRFRVTVIGADTFSIANTSATNINSTGYTAWVSGGTCERIYKVTTPYVEADVQTLTVAQSADVVNIAHRSYAPRSLSRASHTSWTLATLAFAPTPTGPTNGVGTRGASGTTTYRYRITTFDENQESLPGREATKNIAAVTQANPAVVTSTAHGYSTGDEIYITAVGGMTQLNGLTFTISVAGADSYSLVGINSTAYGAYTSGGTTARTYLRIDLAATPTTAAPNVLTWNPVTGAEQYFVYREVNGVYGYIGVANPTAAGASSVSFNDTNIVPDTADSPPEASNPFTSANNYPGIVAFYQGRLLWASTNSDPEKIWTSRSGDYYNLTHSFPLLDDDGIEFTLNGKEINTIRGLVDTGKLLILTSGGEWAVLGDGAGILRPGDVNAKQYGYDGSSEVQPVIVAGQVIYIQARGSLIRNLGFEFSTDSYEGEDLTLTAQHLVDGYTITDIAAQQNPNSIIWAVRSDGDMVGFTYVPQQQLLCWHHHDTLGGTIENVCSVPEGTEDALYVVVKRTVNSRTVRYVERLASRFVDAVEDCIFMDCNATYDGTNTGAVTITATSTSYTSSSIVTLTANSSMFAAADVGDAIFITAADGIDYRFVIVGYSSGTVVTATPHATAPSDIRAVATTAWKFARDTVTGLFYLEGKSVSVLGDGFVVADPNDDSYTAITVTNGSITLPRAFAVVQIGLPIIADVQTLNIDSAQTDPSLDKMKIINKVYVFTDATRGLWAGTEPPSDDDTDPLEGLQRLIDKVATTASAPEDLETETNEVQTSAEWNLQGSVFIRQTAPLPSTILEIAPAGYIGGK